MPIGRPITPVTLSEQERTSLQNWARRPKSAQALAQNSRRNPRQRSSLLSTDFKDRTLAALNGVAMRQCAA